jgi:2-keto-4-pentenoate hydratase
MTEAGQDRALADRLRLARMRAELLGPETLPPLDLDHAYRIQDELASLTVSGGAAVAGWKVGLTSPAALAAFSASEPIAGRLFAPTLLPSGSVLDFDATCAARVEGEILFEIAQPPEPPFEDRQLLESLASVRAAFEIADSRIAGWPKRAPEAVADDACCGWVIVGEPHPPDNLDLASIGMSMHADGTLIGQGTGANCLGNPLNVYRWFVEKAAALDWRIEPGQMLLTGAIAPPVPAEAGISYDVRLDVLGGVAFSFRETSSA